VSLLHRAARRWVFQHPGQVALTVLGVALGVAVVVAIDLAIQSSRAAFAISTETVAGRATHRIEGGPGGLPDSVFTAVRTEAGVRRSAPVVEAWAAWDRLPGTALRVLGIDPFSERPFRPWLAGAGVGGTRTDGAGSLDITRLLVEPGSVILASPLAERAAVVPGDTLRLVVEGRAQEAVLVGLITPADDLARQGLSDLVLTDVSTAQAFVERPGRLTRVDLILPPELGDLEAALLELLPPGASLTPVGTRAATLQGMLRAFDLNLTALSLLALVFGMFLIYNAMTFSVVRRRELLGALRAVGVTRAEILRLVGGEALLTGLVGTGLGLGVGIVLGRGLVRLVTRTINDLYFVLNVESLTLPPAVLVKGGLLGVGATLLAAWPAVREAINAPPRATLVRSLGEDRVRRLVPRAAVAGVLLFAAGTALLVIPSRSLALSFAGLFGVLIGAALLTPLATVGFVKGVTPLLGRTVGILGTMAARGVTAALSRTAPAVAALVVAVSVTVGLGIMIQSFRGTVVAWLDHTLLADVYVSPPSPVSSRAEGSLDPALVARLRTADPVSGVSTYRGVELVTDYGVNRVVALDLDPRGEAAFRFLQGTPQAAFTAFRAEDAVLVSEPFAYRNEIGVGDTITLPTDRGERDFAVAAVFRDYGSEQGVVMMARATWDAVMDDDRITSLGIFLDEEVERGAALETLRQAAGPEEAVVIRSNATLRETSLEVFDRTFAITSVLRALAFAVAFIGVLSALMALQLERARELGVLRANGLTPRQVWGLVTTQTGLLGVVAGILAVPLGLVLATVMIHVVNKRSFGWTLGMEVGADILVQAVGLAVAGALLAGLYPAWRMARTSPALALREE
jgi:putative ABC transport system permease protein